jgi:hypothetical protein
MIKELSGDFLRIKDGTFFYSCSCGVCINGEVKLKRGQRYKITGPNGMLVKTHAGDFIRVHEFTYYREPKNE